MRLREIFAKNFRNYQELSVEPHPRFNVFSGENGQGKTNLLEAIYYLGALRSFRGYSPRELLRAGEGGVLTRVGFSNGKVAQSH